MPEVYARALARPCSELSVPGSQGPCRAARLTGKAQQAAEEQRDDRDRQHRAEERAGGGAPVADGLDRLESPKLLDAHDSTSASRAYGVSCRARAESCATGRSCARTRPAAVPATAGGSPAPRGLR